MAVATAWSEAILKRSTPVAVLPVSDSSHAQYTASAIYTTLQAQSLQSSDATYLQANLLQL